MYFFNYVRLGFNILGNGSDIPSYVEPVVTPGHEFSGRVVALGDGAEQVGRSRAGRTEKRR